MSARNSSENSVSSESLVLPSPLENKDEDSGVRIPLAWAQRETFAQQVASAKVNTTAKGYRYLGSKTLSPSCKVNTSGLATASFHNSRNRQPPIKTVFPKRISGFHTLPSAGYVHRRSIPHWVIRSPILRQRSTQPINLHNPHYEAQSVCRHKNISEQNISSLSHVVCDPATSELSSSESSAIGSQFSARALVPENVYQNGIGPVMSSSALVGAGNYVNLPAFPVQSTGNMINGFVHHAGMGLHPCVIPAVHIRGCATDSRSLDSSIKNPYSHTNCCSGGFLMMWIIFSVIMIGIVIGLIVLFVRRNA